MVVVACVTAVSIAAISFIVYDYFRLKHALPSMRVLERQVTHQRAQIQTFAEKIDTLKSDMSELQELEKKIRVIANVEESADGDAIFGVGGPTPEDLDAAIPLTEKPNGLLRQMHDQVEYLQEAASAQKVAFGELYAYFKDRKSFLASTPTIRPTTGWISSRFGYRTSPFTGRREFHQGMDIATRMGTPVVAPADGTVSFAGRKGQLGKTMIIDHGYGILTRYGHLKEFLVKRGARVKRGDKIAIVGNTGRSTAPHLHYEVHLNGIAVNPAKYILD
jgi:murein DD-endopeptidase MepM/ murein hydrolase activator NlpD